MSNPEDLLAILSQANGGPRGGPTNTTSGARETSILSFKAGKMNMTLKENGKYLVEAEMRRGELHVVWTSSSNNNNAINNAGVAASNNSGGTLAIQWKDRRTKTIVNTIPLFRQGDATFERVETGRKGDRVYLLSVGDDENNDSRHFFWMQDVNAEPDEELCVKVNLYMSDYSEAASAASALGGALSANATASNSTAVEEEDAELLRIMQESLQSSQGLDAREGARTTTVPGSATIPTAGAGQVDALGNILESLGNMPLESRNGTPAGERNADSAAASGGTSGGGLTLDMLQGVMAGLVTTSDGETEGESGGNEEEKEEEPMEDEVAKETAADTGEPEIEVNIEEETSTTAPNKDDNAKQNEAEEEELPSTQTKLIVLISNGVYDMVQASNQRDALQTLDDYNIPYETIDGMDEAMRAKRNGLFEISGIRGNYPQIFSKTVGSVSESGEGEEDVTFGASYLGGYDWLNSTGIEDLKALFPTSAHKSDNAIAKKDTTTSNNDTTIDGETNTRNTRRLTVLISNGVYDMVQASNQREALRTLDDFHIAYDTIDGMDPEMREKRNKLFEISGIRGNYPQIFVGGEGKEEGEGNDSYTYLGGYEWLNGMDVEELKKLVSK